MNTGAHDGWRDYLRCSRLRKLSQYGIWESEQRKKKRRNECNPRADGLFLNGSNLECSKDVVEEKDALGLKYLVVS